MKSPVCCLVKCLCPAPLGAETKAFYVVISFMAGFRIYAVRLSVLFFFVSFSAVSPHFRRRYSCLPALCGMSCQMPV